MPDYGGGGRHGMGSDTSGRGRSRHERTMDRRRRGEIGGNRPNPANMGKHAREAYEYQQMLKRQAAAAAKKRAEAAANFLDKVQWGVEEGVSVDFPTSQAVAGGERCDIGSFTVEEILRAIRKTKRNKGNGTRRHQ